MFDLNDEQRVAVAHRGGPLLVLAGAGTGKTGMLAGRVADLISAGTGPGRICLLTFTRRAANEMLSRAGRMTDPAAAAQVWGGTFHAVANRLLRLHGGRLGLAPSFTVLDQGDAVELLGLVRHDTLASAPDGGRAGDGGGRRFPRPDTLGAIYRRSVSSGQPLSDVLARDFPWCADEIAGIRTIFEGYTGRKRSRHLLDFEDLLLAWRALAGVSGGAELLAGLWDHVLVDEFQDTNVVQADILALLRPDGQGLTVVGDDAQAIYSFRAATAHHILSFPERFPGTTVIRLEHNYRSTSPILALANAVMAPASTGFEKVLWSARPGHRRPRLRLCEDECVQAESVCDSILAHRDAGVALHQQAVLFRASHHADALELALARRNIPYVKYGGLKFLEAAHVRDLIGLLRLLDNPWDELAWFRTLQLLDGVGAATARRLMAQLGLGGPDESPMTGAAGAAPRAEPMGAGRAGAGPAGAGRVWAAGDPAVTPLARLLAAPPRIPVAATGDLAGLRTALADCADSCLPGGRTPPPGVQIERLRTWLAPVIERRYPSAPARIADLEHLELVAGAYPDRGRFVAELTLDPPSATGDLSGPPLLDEDWLTLSTVHSAKGGEWDVVHILHAADGMFPSDMACRDVDGIEEERRLLYVALTRARDAVEVYVPLRYHFHRGRGRFSDGHSYAQVSRFLTPDAQALMDIEHLGAPLPPWGTGPGPPGAGAGRGMQQVDTFLAGLWA